MNTGLPQTTQKSLLNDAKTLKRVAETKAVQHPRRIRREHNAGADFAQCRDLLVNVHVEAMPQQRQRGG